jgi:dinuclear metal center YbgI/SA1388 family protein
LALKKTISRIFAKRLNMNIENIIAELEKFAPPQLQEGYDNARLITGNKGWKCSGALLTLDATEAVIEEAIQSNCNLIIAHHPIVFSGLKSINGKNYIERTLIKAIKKDIAIYACHTNLDNVALGVNRKIADKIGLKNLQILSPKRNLICKLYTYVPLKEVEAVKNALFQAGAGEIGNYSECSFSVSGVGTFKGNEISNPIIGNKGERHHEPEVKLEVIFPNYLQAKVVGALKVAHPYEEVAYEVIQTENLHQEIGAGMVGILEKPMASMDFLKYLKKTMQTDCIRYTALVHPQIKKVAICGGAGSFLLEQAKQSGAQIFITGDYKYHQFFDAENDIIIADIGHYESEQFTPELIYDILSQKFGNFALRLSKQNTNPINYL